MAGYEDRKNERQRDEDFALLTRRESGIANSVSQLLSDITMLESTSTSRADLDDLTAVRVRFKVAVQAVLDA